MRKLWLGILSISLFGIQSISAQLVVNSTADSGCGSLRMTIVEASFGDTIYFDSTISGDTLDLDSGILFDKSIVINGENQDISILADIEDPVFSIAGGTTISFIGFKILGGSNTNGCAVVNNGQLKLESMVLTDNGNGGIESIPNNSETGNVEIVGAVEILNAPLRGLLFETNFNDNALYSVTNVGLWNGGSNNITPAPEGWDGVKAGGNSKVEIVAEEGLYGSQACKLTWDPNLTQPTVSLGKHLTGIDSTGYEELYIRYHVKLPNNFKAGIDGTYMPYWKWGRLWQNTTIDTFSNGLIHGNWTENRVDSKYVVWNFGGRIPYTDVNAVWGANEGENLEFGSSGGERIGIDYFVSGSVQENSLGYFEHLWDLNDTSRGGELEDNANQDWHTLEFHFKLATDLTSEDGIFEMWWDGEYQGDYARISGQGGAPTPTGIPTVKDGSGFNFFTFFDNMAGWNADWSNEDFEGYILINDVVIGTSRIGHNYKAGNKY